MKSDAKQRIRQLASAARRSQAEKDELSRIIFDRVERLPQYRKSIVVMWYVDVRDEVRTRHALPGALSNDKTVVVPYCVKNELALFHLESVDDLTPGRFGILEPTRELRESQSQVISVDALEMILVPGVAFDTRGGRIGYGKGYYDRLLSSVRNETTKVGLAFDCQVFEAVPTDRHDVAMDIVVTESRILQTNRSR